MGRLRQSKKHVSLGIVKEQSSPRIQRTITVLPAHVVSSTKLFTKKGGRQKASANWNGMGCLFIIGDKSYGAFTLDVKSMLNENLGGILGGTQC